MSVTITNELASVVDRLEHEVQQNTMTAWALGNNTWLASAFYADEMKLDSDGQRQYVTPYLPYFDLASLTKLLLTNTLIRIAVANQSELLFSPLAECLTAQNPAGALMVDAFHKAPHRSLRLIDFLNHTTGAKAWFWFGRGGWAFLKDNPQSAKAQLMGVPPREKHEMAVGTLVSHALSCLGAGAPGIYSDVNYFLLARILENLSPHIQPHIINGPTKDFIGWQSTLDAYNEQFKTRFFHAALDAAKTKKAVPYYPYLSTERVDAAAEVRWLAEFGPIHDTNANILANLDEPIVSGHAGLFGTVADVVSVTQWFGSSQAALLQKHPEKQNGRFVFGCDTPSNLDSAAGLEHWPLQKNEIVGGFLGYTGTSAWFKHDLDTDRSSTNVLLTNRTAERTRFDNHNVPRLLVVVNRVTNETTYHIKTKESWQHISQEDAEEQILFHSQTSTKIWNQSVLRSPPNLLELRRAIGKQNWQM